ncbi:antigen bsp [Anaeramoeba flamelloides]|uniref:Antigen bsp n=1 Tax=Anaeramoeba flamelloides TaxID=1746091 RepID=A0ABQ8YUP2_9EUKA|nr:antigen bsp [Anaeramoeba flamelloides]
MSNSRVTKVLSEDQFLKDLHSHLIEHWKEINKGSYLKLSLKNINFLNKQKKNIKKINVPTKSGRIFRNKSTTELISELFWFITKLKALKISAPKHVNHSYNISLSSFIKLRKLEIQSGKLSSFQGFHKKVLPNLFDLTIVNNVISSLSEIFTQEAENSKITYSSSLDSLSCPYNQLNEIDDTLQNIISLKHLDLSHNNISKVQNLQKNINLVSLNLGHNRFVTSKGIRGQLGNIVELLIDHNSLEKLDDLSFMYSVRILNISGNLISSFLEIKKLKKLQQLELLQLSNNPICKVKDYEKIIVSIFCDHPALEQLDGEDIIDLKKEIRLQMKREEDSNYEIKTYDLERIEQENSQFLKETLETIKKKRKRINAQITDSNHLQNENLLKSQIILPNNQEMLDENNLKNEINQWNDKRKKKLGIVMKNVSNFRLKIEKMKSTKQKDWLRYYLDEIKLVRFFDKSELKEKELMEKQKQQQQLLFEKKRKEKFLLEKKQKEEKGIEKEKERKNKKEEQVEKTKNENVWGSVSENSKEKEKEIPKIKNENDKENKTDNGENGDDHKTEINMENENVNEDEEKSPDYPIENPNANQAETKSPKTPQVDNRKEGDQDEKITFEEQDYQTFDVELINSYILNKRKKQYKRMKRKEKRKNNKNEINSSDSIDSSNDEIESSSEEENEIVQLTISSMLLIDSEHDFKIKIDDIDSVKKVKNVENIIAIIYFPNQSTKNETTNNNNNNNDDDEKDKKKKPRKKKVRRYDILNEKNTNNIISIITTIKEEKEKSKRQQEQEKIMKQERINSAKQNLNQNSHLISNENDLDLKSQNSQTNSQRSQTKSQTNSQISQANSQKSQTNSQTNSQISQTNSQRSQTKSQTNSQISQTNSQKSQTNSQTNSQISQTNSQKSQTKSQTNSQISQTNSQNSKTTQTISNNTKSQLNINNNKGKTIDEHKAVSSEQEDINNLYGSSESEIDTNDNTSINKDNSSSFSVDTWGSSELNSSSSKEQTSKKQEIKKEQIDNFLNELKKIKTIQDYLSIPKQLKLYLDVIYIKDKKESINLSLTTTFIKAGNPIIEEEPCYLVLTNKFVYLFLQNKNIKENLAWKKKIGTMKQIIWGFGQQYFRMDFSGNSNFIFFTRNSDITFNFTNEPRYFPRNMNQMGHDVIIIQSFSKQIIQKELTLQTKKFTLLQQLQNPTKQFISLYSAVYQELKNGKRINKSIFITQDLFIKCTEDLSKGPDNPIQKKSYEQFQDVQFYLLKDLSKISVRSSKPGEMKILFLAGNGKNSKQLMKLYIPVPLEFERIIRQLESSYQKYFKTNSSPIIISEPFQTKKLINK